MIINDFQMEILSISIYAFSNHLMKDGSEIKMLYMVKKCNFSCLLCIQVFYFACLRYPLEWRVLF